MAIAIGNLEYLLSHANSYWQSRIAINMCTGCSLALANATGGPVMCVSLCVFVFVFVCVCVCVNWGCI